MDWFVKCLIGLGQKLFKENCAAGKASEKENGPLRHGIQFRFAWAFAKNAEVATFLKLRTPLLGIKLLVSWAELHIADRISFNYGEIRNDKLLLPHSFISNLNKMIMATKKKSPSSYSVSIEFKTLVKWVRGREKENKYAVHHKIKIES